MAEKRKMLLLHHYRTGAEIWCDPAIIGIVEGMEAEPKGHVLYPDGIPPRTNVWCHGGDSARNFHVSELPSEIAAYAGWEIQNERAATSS